MGQVLGKVLLTSRENELLMVILEQVVYSGYKVINTLSLVTGLPGPVTRIHKYYKLI